MSIGSKNLNPAGSAPLDGRYDPTTIRLHWVTAVLVVVLWAIGMTADWLPRGPSRSGAWSIHVVLGFALGVVLLARIAWRSRFGRVLPPADTGALHLLAEATHYALYALLVIVVASGMANASYRGFNLFEVWSVPQFGTGDRAIRRSINGWHELAANITLALAFLHAVAALAHRFWWRDRVLERMMPGA